MNGLTLHGKYARALMMPLPSDAYFQLPSRLHEKSEAAPRTILPPWDAHIALCLASILQFFIERNKKINGHQLSCFSLFASPEDTLATYLQKGFELFSPTEQAELFGMPPPVPPQEDVSPFNSIWNTIARTWRFILENDPMAPWKDNLVKNTLLQRGDFELRFYIFQNCVVEYFTTIALARTTLTSGLDVGMSFGEQEHAAWCSMMASVLLLFKGKGLEQMGILESTLLILYEIVPAMEVDVEAAVQRLLEDELRMRYTLVHYTHRQVLEMYSDAYTGLARRVVQVYQTLNPSEFGAGQVADDSLSVVRV